MKKTRDQIQFNAKSLLRENKYNGTICLSTGTGKSKIPIDIIKEDGFKNILITSPRTNLKTNWRKELEKWEFTSYDKFYQQLDNPKHWWKYREEFECKIILENIQTCYKWTKEQLAEYDLIVCDEIHTMVTEEYGQLLVLAKKLNIPVIGLTATPDNDKLEKKEMYDKYCPILYEYYDSAIDGFVNKRKYIVYQYNLSNDYIVQGGTKKKPFDIGELDQYEYLTDQIRKGQRLMAGQDSEDWWNDAVNWFYKGNGDYDQKTAARIYLNGIKQRKEFLWNLNSSSSIALKIKERILTEMNNKVLLFSENINQAKKLSSYSIHSKQKAEVNEQILQNFDEGIIREIASVRSLTLGLNIKGANYIIKDSYNGSAVSAKQKMGRSDRLAIDEIATVVWIVPMDTQAEQWYKKAMYSVENDEINYYTDITELINDL